MLIEIHGAGFYNKGAELMLRTTIDELSKRLPQAVFAVDPTVGPYEQRGELGLRQIVPPRWWMGSSRFRTFLAAQRLLDPILDRWPFRDLLEIYGGVALSQVDALVDVSGFAFTDQWGPAPIRDFHRLVRAYKKRERPVVMMPQGLGPFENPDSADAMQRLCPLVDLIYARDDTSMQHIQSVATAPERMRKAPDITLFYPEMISETRPAAAAEYNCIIPNVRMLKQGRDKWEDRYERLLARIGNTMASHGETVHLLVHDTTGHDIDIAKRLQQAMDTTPEIVQKDDPVALKNFIAKSRLIISSRYHGAIAAFSKAVPSLCLGWAHKYEMLYKDFGCESHIIYHDTGTDEVLNQVENLLDDATNDGVREQIYGTLQELQSVNRSMWDDTVATLTSGLNERVSVD